MWIVGMVDTLGSNRELGLVTLVDNPCNLHLIFQTKVDANGMSAKYLMQNQKRWQPVVWASKGIPSWWTFPTYPCMSPRPRRIDFALARFPQNVQHLISCSISLCFKRKLLHSLLYLWANVVSATDVIVQPLLTSNVWYVVSVAGMKEQQTIYNEKIERQTTLNLQPLNLKSCHWKHFGIQNCQHTTVVVECTLCIGVERGNWCSQVSVVSLITTVYFSGIPLGDKVNIHISVIWGKRVCTMFLSHCTHTVDDDSVCWVLGMLQAGW